MRNPVSYTHLDVYKRQQETVYQYSAGDFEDYQTLRNQGQTAGLRRNAGSNRGVSDGGRDQSGNLGSLQDKDQVTFSLKNVSKLDYETLVSKPDMKITPITYSQDVYKRQLLH